MTKAKSDGSLTKEKGVQHSEATVHGQRFECFAFIFLFRGHCSESNLRMALHSTSSTKSIDTTVVSGVLYDAETNKSKKSKKTDVGPSERKVKVEKKNKSPKVKPASVEESSQQIISPISTTIAATSTIESSQEKEIIPSKTGVFRRLKFKVKSLSQLV
ncbi:unnamed protein product [Lactuca saligna]|uniref:Uncharacterized protein n=1 Tax=Lactuca saligna TaxID=75948 RepID=A0AA36E025_LACSI|nr:unnamed protein product [Lactuca saligna]